MPRITIFLPAFASRLPGTHRLLLSANLTVHSLVRGVVLHGSRGYAGGCRPDSDIDLSLLVDTPPVSSLTELEAWLHEIISTTLDSWQADIEPGLAIVYDTRGCGLTCFDQAAWDELLCPERGGAASVDCFGLYKTQKGFRGLVQNAGVQVKRMYPCMKIWERQPAEA